MGKAGSKNLSLTLQNLDSSRWFLAMFSRNRIKHLQDMEIVLTGAGERLLHSRHCTLWKTDRSPACRAVMMALDAMNISLTEVDVNMDKAEHRVPELTAMNPQQTLPIFKDRQLVLCDSHVISTYLASRYCSSDYTLPEDPGGRAIVDQLLHFDSGILQPNYRASAYPIFYENCQFVMPQQIAEIECSYQDLEKMLIGRTWFSGSRFTLGDIALAASVSTLNILVPVDRHRFPMLSSWLFRMSEQAFYITANKKGLQEFWKRIDSGIAADLNEFKKCPRSSLTRRSHGGKISER